MQTRTEPTRRQWLTWSAALAVLLLLAAGFGLRLYFLQQMRLHVDEFLSLLSIRMILDKGFPILPTGIFHGKGLVYNYLGAATALVAGYQIETLRYLTLALSLLTILIVYGVAVKLFGRPWTALLAAGLFALHPMAVEWGARVRMYTLATLLVYLLVLVAWLYVTHRGRWPYLLLLAVTLLVTLYSHLVTIVIVPPLVVMVVTIYWLNHKPQFSAAKDWTWLIGLGLAIIVVCGLGYFGREPGEVQQWTEEASVAANLSRAIIELRIVRNFINFFLIPPNLIATLLTGLGLVGLVWKARQRRLDQVDLAGLMVIGPLCLIFLELYLIVPDSIRDERHNFIVLFPFLTLSMAYGAGILAELWQAYSQQRGAGGPAWLAPALGTLLFGGMVATQWTALTGLLFGQPDETYRYDLAFLEVGQRMAPGDQLFSVLPPAAFIYQGPLDYYANHHKPRVLIDPVTNQRRDYYTGGRYLETPADLHQAIGQPGRLWFVVDSERLVDNYNEEFAWEVLHEMALVDRVDNLLIFTERDRPWLLPLTPTVTLTQPANFSDQMALVGYTPELAGTELRLTLFWQAIDPIFPYKIFVHLRNQEGQTVAQADYAPFDHVVPISRWRIDWPDEVVPTGTTLSLPPEILASDPTTYQLYLGLYVPELDSQRVPLLGDRSGENALILTDLGWQDEPPQSP